MLNYELMRPMFEAFQVNQKNATGIIQWMLNSAWPELYWQLYDSFLMPNGAYFGAKKANQPIQIIYNYGDENVYLVNNSLNDLENLSAEIQIFDIDSNLILSENINLNIEKESYKKIFDIPKTLALTKVYFVDARIYCKSKDLIANNFYWLSTQNDVMDYEAKVEGWNYYTPSKQYADFKEIENMPKCEIKIEYEKTDKNNIAIKATNMNNKIAFFIEILLFDKNTNEVILPVLWDDNYFSLLPNENKTIEAKILKREILDNFEVRLKGWNIK